MEGHGEIIAKGENISVPQKTAFSIHLPYS